jgi:hypothetical protein
MVTELLRWWYSDGLRGRIRIIANRLDGTLDYFSIDLLIKTLFAPFRQISAGRVDGPLGIQMRAMVDRLFSRVIGAIVRLFILIIGGVAIALQALAGVLIIIVWTLVPLLPLLGIIMAIIGVKF